MVPRKTHTNYTNWLNNQSQIEYWIFFIKIYKSIIMSEDFG